MRYDEQGCEISEPSPRSLNAGIPRVNLFNLPKLTTCPFIIEIKTTRFRNPQTGLRLSLKETYNLYNVSAKSKHTLYKSNMDCVQEFGCRIRFPRTVLPTKSWGSPQVYRDQGIFMYDPKNAIPICRNNSSAFGHCGSCEPLRLQKQLWLAAVATVPIALRHASLQQGTCLPVPGGRRICGHPARGLRGCAGHTKSSANPAPGKGRR